MFEESKNVRLVRKWTVECLEGWSVNTHAPEESIVYEENGRRLTLWMLDHGDILYLDERLHWDAPDDSDPISGSEEWKIKERIIGALLFAHTDTRINIDIPYDLSMPDYVTPAEVRRRCIIWPARNPGPWRQRYMDIWLAQRAGLSE